MTMIFAFDRDYTVENPTHMTGPIKLSRVTWLQMETPHEVWAVGNQKLCAEAGIPGIEEMANRMGIGRKKIVKHFGDQFDRAGLAHLTTTDVAAEKRRRNVRCKHKRLKHLLKLFPVQSHYIFTDDYPEACPEGTPWVYYPPWEFEERWPEMQSLALGEIERLTPS